MATNVYEGMFILDPNQYARDPQGTPKVVESLLTKAGGEMLVSRLWDERKLAYPIGGHRKGTYWLTYFKLESDKLSGINNELRISEGVLRHLILKVEPRLVDALVEHAKSGAAPEVKNVELGGPAKPKGPVVEELEDIDEEL